MRRARRAVVLDCRSTPRLRVKELALLRTDEILTRPPHSFNPRRNVAFRASRSEPQTWRNEFLALSNKPLRFHFVLVPRCRVCKSLGQGRRYHRENYQHTAFLCSLAILLYGSATRYCRSFDISISVLSIFTYTWSRKSQKAATERKKFHPTSNLGILI